MPITITSRFKPLTYDEITRPLIEQTQAQAALEDAYMQASDQAAQIMAQANQQTDPVAYARLKSYSDELQQQADSLMRQGLNRNSRQSLLNMRRKYNQNILPVQTAINRRNELMEEKRKLQLTNPDMLWERDVVNIDDLLKNPQLDYGSSYNGAMITKRVADAVKAVGKGMASYEATGHLTPYHIKVLERHGFTPEEISNAVLGGQDTKSRFIAGIRDRILNSIDVYNKGNGATRAKALDYANEGLYSGIEDIKFSHVNDDAAQAELGWKYQKKAIDYKNGERPITSPKFQTRTILTDTQQDAQNKSNDFIEKGFIAQKADGTYEVTALGKKALEEGRKTADAGEYNAYVNMRILNEGEHAGHIGAEKIKGSSAFYDFMVYGAGAYNKKIGNSGKTDYTIDNNALTRIVGTAKDSYDAYSTNEYKRQLPASSYNDIAAFVNSIANANGEVYAYAMANEKGSYKLKRGDVVKASEVTGSTISSASTVNGVAGDYLELTLKDGKKVRIPLSSFDQNASIMLQGNHGTIASYVEALAQGYLFDSNGNPLEDLITEEINSMGDNSISIFGVYNPEKSKVDNTYQQSTTSRYYNYGK